jgi:acetyl-CoA carboxylase biotin carboxyl carrier protein
MTIDELKTILEMVREHELVEFELERNGMKLRVRKDGSGLHVGAPAPVPAAMPPGAPVMLAPAVPPVPAPGAGAALQPEDAVELAVVTSPIVGTFYRSPSPGAPSFVEVGALVTKGQVLCIIEAMKLMNEIESEYSGEVVKVYVENGQPVQYGERLFALRAR